MTTDELRWYPSKIDWWLVPFLCLPPVAAVAVCVASALAGSITNLLVGVAVTALVVGLYFGLVFPIRYGINDTYSLDRLHVKFGQGFFKAVMISPSDRDVFLDDLTKQAGLKRVGDRLCRN